MTILRVSTFQMNSSTDDILLDDGTVHKGIEHNPNSSIQIIPEYEKV
jgi:hypothetical protein